jgi:hypothetical protein
MEVSLSGVERVYQSGSLKNLVILTRKIENFFASIREQESNLRKQEPLSLAKTKRRKSHRSYKLKEAELDC